MTATQQLSRDLGWSYFEKLAKQKVMQVQSAADPPKKVSAGERAVMADGTEYMVDLLQVARRADRGGLCRRGHAAGHRPVGRDGACRQSQRGAAVLRLVDDAPRRSSSMSTSARCARCIRWSRTGPSRKKLSDIKTLREDAAAVADQADEIKARYLKLFKV